MALRYANGFRPRAGGRNLLKETLAEIKEADQRNRKPPSYYNRQDRKDYFRSERRTDFIVYSNALGISFLQAYRRAWKQAKHIENFREYDL